MLTYAVLVISFFIRICCGQKTIYLTEEIIKREGYESETHHLVTSDGYMLAMHRVPFKRFAHSGDLQRPVVLLLHGIFGASNSFISLGRQDSIGYNFADAGFDVWMGNVRGTKNSRFHIELDPDDPNDKEAFFDFTFEEIGIMDLAEMVDFILAMTAKSKLHFVGHGAAGTAFLALNSLKPEYNDKFLTAHLLGGVGYQLYFKNNILSMLAHFTNTYLKIASALGIYELFPPGSADNAASWTEVPKYCTGDYERADVCDLMGVKEIMGTSFLKNLLDFETAGASVKQLAHYGQNIKAKRFRRYDHGTQENLARYGTPEPPIYNLHLVTVNVTLHYSTADHLVSEADVKQMSKDMPNAKKRKVPKESFQHFDYVVSHDVRVLVTEYMIKDIMQQERSYSPYHNEIYPWYIPTMLKSQFTVSFTPAEE